MKKKNCLYMVFQCICGALDGTVIALATDNLSIFQLQYYFIIIIITLNITQISGTGYLICVVP